MNTDFPSLCDEAKKRFQEHPPWKMLRHTPWENDAPIIAAELARDALVAASPSQKELAAGELQRYRPWNHPTDDEIRMEADDSGEWVAYDAHLSAMSTALARVKDLEQARDAARTALGGFGDPNGPFGGDLTNGINAISLRCASAEKDLSDLRARLNSVEEEVTKLRDQWVAIGLKQRELADGIKERELKASMIACSNAWMSCADDLKKVMEKTK